MELKIRPMKMCVESNIQYTRKFSDESHSVFFL